jgi:hypothetical protein
VPSQRSRQGRPAFVLCIADKTGAEQRAALAKLFSAVLAQAQALATRVDAAQLIGARYALAPSDVADWLRTTRWSAHADVSAADLAPVVAALGALGLVPAGFAAEQALARF